MLCGVEHGRLQADEIAWQEEVQNLAAALGQHFEAERPAGIERVEFRAVVTGSDDLAACRHHEMIALDLVDHAKLIRGDGLEWTAGAQCTFEAGNLHRRTCLKADAFGYSVS